MDATLSGRNRNEFKYKKIAAHVQSHLVQRHLLSPFGKHPFTNRALIKGGV